MGKRQKVPKALHSELSEYSSLLRALRASNTLDLASHLAAASSQVSPTPVSAASAASVYEDDDDEDDDDFEDGQQVRFDDEDGGEGESERPATETVASLDYDDGSSQDSDAADGPKTKRKASRRLKAGSKTTSKARAKTPKDTWTRWPLLAGDVHVPEWSLQDEVRLLATQALRTHSSLEDPARSSLGDAVVPADISPEASGSTSTAAAAAAAAISTAPSAVDAPLGSVPAQPDAEEQEQEEEEEEEDDVDTLLPPPVLDALTASSARYLSQLLALLAAYVPAREKSMQNRLHPVSWESVLDVAALNGLLPTQYVSVLLIFYTAFFWGESLNWWE